MSAAQGLLNSVFSCSSPASKAIAKRRLRQTRSLDPAIIRHCGNGSDAPFPAAGAPAGAKAALRARIPVLKEPIAPSLSSPSIPSEVSPSSNFHFDYELVKRAKRISAAELPRGGGAAQPASAGTLFSPRRWLQRKVQPACPRHYVVWNSEGDFTWSSLSGRTVRLTPVAIQSLSELERARLQEVAFNRLVQDYDLGCQITMPKDGQKRKKSLRRKLDSLAKEKSKDKGRCVAFFFFCFMVSTFGAGKLRKKKGAVMVNCSVLGETPCKGTEAVALKFVLFRLMHLCSKKIEKTFYFSSTKEPQRRLKSQMWLQSLSVLILVFFSFYSVVFGGSTTIPVSRDLQQIHSRCVLHAPMTGNKMTSLNLATIFGPNLLHKQKNSDKEFSVQSSARAEESTAVIAVLQKMIASYQSLFMVPPDLQNEVLMNLMETDPDVVDYLLRRKASQSPDLLQSEEPFNLSEHHSSTDSNKASSGEVSPYDNNSPVLSERRGESGSSPGEQLANVPENYSEVGQETDSWGSKGELLFSSVYYGPFFKGSFLMTHFIFIKKNSYMLLSEEHANIWGTWHSTLKPALKSQSYTGNTFQSVIVNNSAAVGVI
uniref:Rho GTPase activating protein 6 n=1 Tax=Oryzias sinensis TaxID=183150 RepID=A0A8C7ZE81_9TELE